MCEVAGADDGDSLEPGPVIEVFGGEAFGSGAGVMGVDMEVSDKFHRSCSCVLTKIAFSFGFSILSNSSDKRKV